MRSHHLAGTHAILLALIFLFVIVNQFFTLPCPDMAWLSLATSRMLDGEKLYRDILPATPPSIFWIYAVPVALAKAFSWPHLLTIRYFVLLLAAADIFICQRILKHSPLWNKQERRSLLLGIAGILLLLPDNFIVFSQREHLLVIFTLPYLLASLPSIPADAFSRWQKIALGIFAALGFTIKPHFFAVWIGVLAYRLWRNRFLRSIIGPAEIAIVVITLVYGATILLFFPQYLSWLRIVAPIYNDYGRPADTALGVAIWFAALAVAGIAVAWAFGLFKLATGMPWRQDVFFLASAAAGAYIEALAQFNAWGYTSYPFLAFGLLALLPLIVRKPATHFLSFAVIAVAFFPVTPLNDARQDDMAKGYHHIMRMLTPYRNLPDIYFITGPSLPPLFYRYLPPLELKSSQMNLNGILFGIMERSPVTGSPTQAVRPGQEWRARWLQDNIAIDIEKKHPSLIVVMSSWNPALSAKDQYLDLGRWLNENEKFMQAVSDYTLVCPKAAKPCQTRIYVRTPGTMP